MFINHHNTLSLPLALSHLHPFVPLRSSFYILLFASSWSHTASPLLPFSYPPQSLLSIIGWHFANQWYQLAFTVNEILPLFSLSQGLLNSTFLLIIHSIPECCVSDHQTHHLLVLSLFCALGICPYILGLWLMSKPLFISTSQLIFVKPENGAPVKAFEVNSVDFLSF